LTTIRVYGDYADERVDASVSGAAVWYGTQLLAVVRAHDEAAFADLSADAGLALLAAYCAVAYQLRDAFYSFDRSPPRAPRIEDVT